MLNPQARYLSRNQKKFVLDSDSSSSSDNTDSDFDPNDPELLRKDSLKLA